MVEKFFKEKPLLTSVLFIVSYVCLAKLGLSLAFENSNATPIWPPSGLAIAFIFLIGKRLLPSIFISALISNFFTLKGADASLFDVTLSALSLGFSNTLEAFLAYTLFKISFDENSPLDTVFTFTVFVAVVIASCFATAFLATFTLWHFEFISASNYSTILITWWLGDIIGVITVGSLLLALINSNQRSKGSQFEYILTLICSSILSIIIFSHVENNSFLARIYFLIIPILLWVTFRFSLVRLLFAVNLIGLLATLGTAYNRGPFQSDSSNDALLLMQCFIGCITFTFILINLQLHPSTKPVQIRDPKENRVSQSYAFLAFAISITISIFLANNYSSTNKQKLNLLFNKEVAHTNTLIYSQLNSLAKTLIRLAERQKLAKQPTRKLSWENDASSYIKHIGQLEQLDYLSIEKNQDLTLRRSFSSLPKTYKGSKNVPTDILDQFQKNSIYIETPKKLKNDLSIIRFYAPNFNSNKDLLGMVVATFNTEKLINSLIQTKTNNYDYIIQWGSYKFNTAANTRESGFSKESYFSFANFSWKITAIPKKDVVMSLNNNDWGIHVLVGLVLSFLLAVTVYLSINSNSKANALENLNQSLNRKNAELLKEKISSRQAAQAKDSFLTNMSHEIRTPMNGVLGALQLAKDCTPEELPQYLRAIDVSAKNLMKIIDEILDYSNMESGEISIDTISFDLKELINNTSEIISSAATIKGLEVETIITDDIPKYIIGDPIRLRQIVLNLLSNALKFTHDGKIKVIVSKDFNEMLKIEVSDTGLGIPEHETKNIFSHFEQVDMSATRGIGGAGLGLSICRNLVSMMAGTISVNSTVGKGSNFIVKIPLIEGIIPTSKQELTENELFSKKVLICEDNPTDSLIFKKMLQKIGLQVIHTDNGEDALKVLLCDWQKIDMIFMDLEMPKINGLDVAKSIKQQIPAFDRPIVAITANCSSEYKEKCERAGMKNLLAKPVTKETLHVELQKWLILAS
ncbi:MAG: MASE1 domain-containing protein [Lentisphaeraceae bacterium]|nr:MASE1 domain-containing protein [Lentisphaeraceae bacterium]